MHISQLIAAKIYDKLLIYCKSKLWNINIYMHVEFYVLTCEEMKNDDDKINTKIGYKLQAYVAVSVQYVQY